MTYDELCVEYQSEVTVFEHTIQMECENLGIYGVKGLYKNKCIAIDRYINRREKKCTLAEELGHHYTSTGNVLDLRYSNNSKQERIAREWAAKKLICYDDFVKACEIYNNDIYLIAEELDVTYEVIETYYTYLYRTHTNINPHEWSFGKCEFR